MIRNWYKLDPIACPKIKRELTKYINCQQFPKSTRNKPDEQLFARQVVIHLQKARAVNRMNMKNCPGDAR